MKRDAQRLGLCALLATAVLAGCGSDDGGGPMGPSTGGEVVRVSGALTSNTTWTAGNTYLLQGAVFVRPGATLTIQAGTRILGEKSSLGTLIVDRGARIDAQGSATSPIVMTSDRPVGQRARGDWGGLVINGDAPLNVAGGIKVGEGGTGQFGGNNVNDSSGALRYVRVEFAGIEFSPDNELNGIAFQGVGAGTTCDHLQVHYNLDDAFEWFGGTVACKYLLATASGDDSFDWTDGWQGRGQFWIAQQKGDDADAGFESDNLEGSSEAEPRSFPRIYNVTLIGDPTTQFGTQSTHGMVLRRGTAGEFRNFIVMGFKQRAVDVRDASQAQASSGALSLRNAILHGNGGGGIFGAPSWAGDPTIVSVDPALADPYNLTSPNWQPAPASLARSGALAVAAPPNDGFFEAVNFIGAIGATDWTRGWTTAAAN